METDNSRSTTIMWGMAAIALAIHVAVNLTGGYGFFRDELYFLACSDHLGAGYVDHPPLSVFVLALFRLFLGSSLFAVRLPAALAGAGGIVFTGLIAREMGGGAGRFSSPAWPHSFRRYTSALRTFSR